jgi:hypothetical protein
MTTTPTPAHISPDEDQDGPFRRSPKSTGRIGWVVASSLAVGLLAALLVAAAPFVSPEENDVTGAVLCGFALGGSPTNPSGGQQFLPCSWEWVVCS